MEFESIIFEKAFDKSIYKNETLIDNLYQEIKRINKRFEPLLATIEEELPTLTDHSINHSLILWKYIDIIAGKTIELNPLEAFILHITFLIHDAGMCTKILGNEDEITNDTYYINYLEENGNNENNKQIAKFNIVRENHGEYAERIVSSKLSDDKYLIENNNIRDEYASLIGKIAKSHTCDVSYIENEIQETYTQPSLGETYTVDCHKLAYLLRTADAANLDNLRTPKSWEIINNIPSFSKNHWTFQKKLGLPKNENGFLIYTSNSNFTITEQKAWWLCYDSLKILDDEIKKTNSYFNSKKKPELSVKGVKFINNTLELGKTLIKTQGWSSIDSNIKISNPAALALKLGGLNLYNNKSIAIRELIQNSIDAINILSNKNNNVEHYYIKISLFSKNNKTYLSILDNGIGMSELELAYSLLDFGKSSWSTSLLNNKNIKNQNQLDNIIGKYGIGFYSIFMLANKVNVTSWQHGSDKNKCKTLEFYDGLNLTPIIREPSLEEKNILSDFGTYIEIELISLDFLNNMGNEAPLYTLVKNYIANSPCKIIIEENKTSNIIPANNLFNLKLIDVFKFINPQKDKEYYKKFISLCDEHDLDLIELKDEFKNYGSLFLLPYNNAFATSAVATCKGIIVQRVHSFVGYIIVDEIDSIKRDSFVKNVPFDVLRNWAEKQKKIIEDKKLVNQYYSEYNSMLMKMNIYDDNLPILIKRENNEDKYISIREFKADLKELSEIKIFSLNSFKQTSTVEGYVYIKNNFHVENILKESDIEKLTKYTDLISSTINSVWGSSIYQNLDMIEYNLPFLSCDIYKKQ